MTMLNKWVVSGFQVEDTTIGTYLYHGNGKGYLEVSLIISTDFKI